MKMSFLSKKEKKKSPEFKSFTHNYRTIKMQIESYNPQNLLIGSTEDPDFDNHGHRSFAFFSDLAHSRSKSSLEKKKNLSFLMTALEKFLEYYYPIVNIFVQAHM